MTKKSSNYYQIYDEKVIYYASIYFTRPITSVIITKELKYIPIIKLNLTCDSQYKVKLCSIIEPKNVCYFTKVRLVCKSTNNYLFCMM